MQTRNCNSGRRPRTVASVAVLSACALAGMTVQRHRSHPALTSTPDGEMAALISALKTGSVSKISALATPNGMRTLAPPSGMLPAYTGDHYQRLAPTIASFRRIVGKSGWQETSDPQITAEVRWKGGSGRSTDRVTLVRQNGLWKLESYVKIWDR